MKKSIYIQPIVEVTNIMVSSIICAGSATPPDIHFGGQGLDPDNAG